ncbi:MAG: hemolysin family protein [Methylococcaceae bacterium]
MELLILVFLFVINGLFAMSEIAIVSSRKTRLQQSAQEGKKAARLALQQADNPSHFLSTIQIGITSIGIFSGAYGEAALSSQLAQQLQRIPELAPYSSGLALALVVLGITYCSLIIGELVPKRLALLRPEPIAMLMARPMSLLATLAFPLVKILSLSTDFILKILGVASRGRNSVTEKEIKMMIEEGTEAGLFHKSEQVMLSNVLRLDDLRVGAIMTPRMDVYYLDTTDTIEHNRHRIFSSPHSNIPVCQQGLDTVVGFIQAKDVLNQVLMGTPLDLERLAKPVPCLPKTLTPLQVMEQFKKSRLPMALVVDEYGDVEGLVTLRDVLEYIAGDLLMGESEEEPEAIQREDGSWLLDGMLSIEKFRQIFDLDSMPEESRGDFNTLAGFVVMQLGYVPRSADHFEWNNLRFEVVDMDRNRVDKIMVSRIGHIPTTPLL